MKIKDIPISEQPRERLMQYGVDNLSNADLISIILRTGVKDLNVKEVSNNILNSVANINELSNIGIRELSNIKGVGNVKAITLMASIELGKRVISKPISIKMKLNSSVLIFNSFKSIFIGLKQEKFLAIFLDHKKSLISYKVLFVGTIDRAIVHPREIFNEALKVSASSIIVMHNHPSGDLHPSKEDIKITDSLKNAGQIIGIPLLDHIITDGEGFYSFYENKEE